MTQHLYLMSSALIMLGYAVLTGIVEAHLFYYKNKTNEYMRPTYLHFIFTILRGILLGVILINPTIEMWFTAAVHGFSIVLMFSFIHNGVYYMQRNKLDPNIYIRKFFDSSTTSSAWIEMDFPTRLGCFICGVAVLTVNLLNIVG